jgi:hypothetical protein
MQINGEWLPCDDGILKPVVRGEVEAPDGFWEPVLFLLDIGADRTVGRQPASERAAVTRAGTGLSGANPPARHGCFPAGLKKSTADILRRLLAICFAAH